MILDHDQFVSRLFNIIEHNGDIYDIEKLLYKISALDLNYLNYNGQCYSTSLSISISLSIFFFV